MTNDTSEATGALRHAAGQVNRTGVTFVAVCAYFGIAAGATTHAALLTGRALALPLLDTELPVYGFYLVAPIILVLLQLHLLVVQLYFRRTLDNSQIAKALQSQLSILSSFGVSLAPRALALRREEDPFPRFVLQALFLVVNVGLPLGVLIGLQAQILPRHSTFLLWWHRSWLLIDVGLLLYLVPAMLSKEESWLAWWRRVEGSRVFHGIKRLAFTGLLAMALVASFLLIEDPSGAPCDQRYALPFLDWPRYHLDLSHGNFSVPQGLRLVAQDLRCADFEGLDLHGVDFRYSDIRGANFDRADLRFARFGTTARGSSHRSDGLEGDGALAIGASFRHADLRGASFDGVDLTRADLAHADAAGATFREAKLRGADLTSASLLASRLDEARLEGATLDGARLSCATARGTWLDLASLRRARLEAVDFRGSSAWGADLQQAVLWESSGLALAFENLRGAELWGTCPVPEGRSTNEERSRMPRQYAVAQSSDFRSTSFTRYNQREWQRVVDEVDIAVRVIERMDHGGFLGTGTLLSRVPPLCRKGADASPQSRWSNEDERRACFPRSDDAPPRSTNLLTPDAADGFRSYLGWPDAKATNPGDEKWIHRRWVARFTSRCGDPIWMEVLLRRFFLLGHPGFETIESDLSDVLRWRRHQGCPGLEEALRRICHADPQVWNRAIDRFSREGAGELSCDGGID